MAEERDELRELYPFLHGGHKDPAKEGAALLESVRQKAGHSVDVKRVFFEQNAQGVVDAAAPSPGSIAQGGRMFAMGNGGSSCDAAHFAVEFLHPITAGRPALAAINLTTDVAMLTAVGNDVSFEHIFVRQVIAHGTQGRRPDRLFDERQLGRTFWPPTPGPRQWGSRQSGSPAATAARWRRAPISITVSWCRPTASTACRRCTSRPITSSGTWCTRCSRTTGAISAGSGRP